MKTQRKRLLLVCACLLFAARLGALAQAPGGGPPHGGPPPGSVGSGGPGGPGGPGSGSPPPSSSGAAGKSATGSGTRSSVQFGPVGRWWDDKSVVKTVGLTKDQQKKMDGIFDANKPAILQAYKTFLSEQSKLDKLNKDPKVDQQTLFTQIDAVSKARSSLEKATAQMLLGIRQQMDAAQIAKLEKLQ
jgi:hypothetical protein